MVVKKIAVLFSGSGSNLQSILDKLHGKIFDGIKIEVVLTLSITKILLVGKILIKK